MIIPTGIDSTFFISSMRERIKNVKIFPLPDLKMLKKLNNKWEFVKILSKYSMSYPNTALIDKSDKLKNLKIKFPIMVKPLEMHSGLGVKKIDSLNGLYIHIQSKNKYNSFPLIVQEYVEGFNVDISLLAKDGRILAWTIQKTLSDGSIKFIKNAHLLNLTKKIIAECSYSGVAHIDTIFDNKNRSIKILEFNPRFWGSLLGSKMAGINFPYLGLLVAQNRSIATHLKYKEINYVTTKNILWNLWKNKLNKKKPLSLSVTDFWQMAYDPFPYIYLSLFEGRRKLKEFFSKVRGDLINRQLSFIFTI